MNYKDVIDHLMWNDSNGTWDEIETSEELERCLHSAIEREEDEQTENFYIWCLLMLGGDL